MKNKIIPKVMLTSEQTIRFDFSSFEECETSRNIQAFCQFIERIPNPLIEDIVPSYETVTVFYQKELINPYEIMMRIVTKWSNSTDDELIVKTRSIEIPVCYDGYFSEDMGRIMDFTGLSREEIIRIHTHTEYTVSMIGFLPGFPYLAGLAETLHVPRLEKPRLQVAKGTVGIGGTQTGIYPLESPGGWNILGRTPLDIYNLKRVDPFFIRAGDSVSFRSISLNNFNELKRSLEREPEIMKQFMKE